MLYPIKMQPSSDPSAGRGSLWQVPLVRVLSAQAMGGVIAVAGGLGWTALSGMAAPIPAVLIAMGLVAAWIGWRLFGLEQWWLPVQIVLPGATAATSLLPIPGWIYLALFAVLALLYWNSARGRVPLYLSNQQTRAALSGILPDKPGLTVVDAGSGPGGTLLYLSAARPDCRFIGYETAPLVFAIAWFRLRLSARKNLQFLFADFWKQDFSSVDAVYCFLSPAPMPALYEKLQAELADGAVIISNSFTVPDAAADEIIEIADRRRTRLHIWRIKQGP